MGIGTPEFERGPLCPGVASGQASRELDFSSPIAVATLPIQRGRSPEFWMITLDAAKSDQLPLWAEWLLGSGK